MIIYPAIDLRGGKVVRLREGDPKQQTVFSEDPVATARGWVDAGAAWLHVVNLDGAFGSANENLRVLEQIARLGVPVQFGGGLRDLDAMRTAIDYGATRLVLGTVAVQSPDSVRLAAEAFGEDAVCVALDARNGVVVTHGWQQATEISPMAMGLHHFALGARHALYTDVARDGGDLRGGGIEELLSLMYVETGGRSLVVPELGEAKAVPGDTAGLARNLELEIELPHQPPDGIVGNQQAMVMAIELPPAVGKTLHQSTGMGLPFVYVDGPAPGSSLCKKMGQAEAADAPAQNRDTHNPSGHEKHRDLRPGNGRDYVKPGRACQGANHASKFPPFLQ